MPAPSSLVLQAREVEKPGARTGLFRLRRCSPGPRYPRCGYSASGQVFLHADEDRRCEAWRVTRFASMGPPSIDYSITLFGGEGNETHGSISARRRGSWHRHLGRFPPPPAYLPPRMGTLMMRPLRVGRSYKGSANCTLDSLRFAISTYSGLISIPTACRPRRSATSKVVPLPAKGSRTMHLPEPS